MNPAVSVAMYMKGAINAAQCLGYSLSQVLGAAIALYTYQTFA